MFRSKQRPIVVPQWEHQKLAGTLALLWGNADFDRPPVPRDSFVAGIGLHDRAYGPQDTLPIGEIAGECWLALTQAGFAQSWSDPVADVIVKMHLNRLVSYGNTPERHSLRAQMTRSIHEQVQIHQLDLATFKRIDRITNLCDRIAFDVCFEVPAEGTVLIFPANACESEQVVHYRIRDGAIEVTPWPFGVERYVGYLVGYQRDGYPAVLEPVLVRYQVVQARG